MSKVDSTRICEMYVAGEPVKTIAIDCGVTVRTVYNHIHQSEIALQGHKRFCRPAGPPLTTEQMEIVNGSMLGDGCIDDRVNRGHNSCLLKAQKPDRREYLQWHFDKLQPYSATLKKRTCKSPMIVNDKVVSHPTKTREFFSYRTKCSPHFSELRKKWYPSGVKVVPDDIELTPLTVAIWLCDDGSNYPKGRRITFATNGFTWGEADMLASKLSKLGFLSHTKSSGRKKNQPLVLISQTYYLDFLDFVRPHMIWPCFEYKASTRGYTAPGPLFNAKLSLEQVEEVRRLYGEGWRQVDLCRRFDLSRTHMARLVHGRAWLPTG